MIVLTHEDANANLEGIVLAKHNESPLNESGTRRCGRNQRDAGVVECHTMYQNAACCRENEHFDVMTWGTNICVFAEGCTTTVGSMVVTR